jgi:anti-sigma factor RsiW
MTGHVSAESLARYAEGLLRGGRAARISAHLADCPECAAEQARLTEVTVLLREIPAAPLPPAVAARLDAALAAESGLRAAQPTGAAQGDGVPQPAGTAQPGGGGDPGRPRRPAGGGRWRWLQAPATVRGLAAAAAVVVLGGVGYGIAQAVSSASSSPSGASTSSGSAQKGKPGARAPVAGPNTPPGMHSGSSAEGSSATIPMTNSGTHYQPGTLGQQAAAQLATSATAPSHPPVSAGPLARQAQSKAALRACALAIAHGGLVRLVDEGSYQGRAALVIVVQGHPPTVYVTSPACTPAHPGVLVKVPLPATG